MLIWLDQPLLPSEYPKTARDLLLVAERAGPEVAGRLAQIAMARQDNIVVVIAADGRVGPGLVVVTVAAPGLARAMPRGTANLDRGFRPSKLPAEVLINRYFGSERVRRDEPARADAPWVHGRGNDARTAKLAGSVVTVLGCGSVGAPVAVALAQAGVGRINLVDHDALAWANVGRHPLGASSVGKNKAEALAAKLRTDYPHSTFEAYAMGAAGMILVSRSVLLESDLIVSAMGSWLAESQLNDWHCREDRPMPIVYGWTEAHACAGHAVVIDRTGGCLRCGVDRTGMPAFRVTAWPEGGSGALEEPACGRHYQAYGPIELGFVTGLVSQAGLDCLLRKADRSTHRLYAARRGLLDDTGGSWSPDFVTSYPGREEGGFIVERDWPHAGCAHCVQAVSQRDQIRDRLFRASADVLRRGGRQVLVSSADALVSSRGRRAIVRAPLGERGRRGSRDRTSMARPPHPPHLRTAQAIGAAGDRPALSVWASLRRGLAHARGEDAPPVRARLGEHGRELRSFDAQVERVCNGDRGTEPPPDGMIVFVCNATAAYELSV